MAVYIVSTTLSVQNDCICKCVSPQLTGIGGMILIAGFLAFNGGSAGSMSKPGDRLRIARAVINTVLGGSGASIVMLGMCKLGLCGKSAWSFSLTLNAALAGMVSIGNEIAQACVVIQRMLLSVPLKRETEVINGKIVRFPEMRLC
jgi:ammonia channel protein AmtB